MMVSIVIPASGGMRWIHPRQRGADLEVDLHPLSAPITSVDGSGTLKGLPLAGGQARVVCVVDDVYVLLAALA
jgi:hypothetical protein